MWTSEPAADAAESGNLSRTGKREGGLRRDSPVAKSAFISAPNGDSGACASSCASIALPSSG